jgi:hypothetical protein
MKKKVLIVLLVLAMLGAGSTVFARTGVGISAGLPIGPGLPGSNLMLSLKLDSFPLLLGLGGQFTNGVRVGITADYWIANRNLASVLNWYIAVGGYLGVSVVNETGSLDAGLRVPIGLNIFALARVLELFVEIAPAIGANFSDPVKFPVIGAQGALGFRVWF